MARGKVVDHLAAVPLFSRCSRSDLKILARHLVEVEVPSGAAVVNEGEEGDAFYVVLEGEVRIRNSPKRNGRTVATLGVGGWFGELAVLDPGPRNATVVAGEGLVVGVLPARVFRAVLRDVPSMTEKLLAGMARRLKEADRRLNADVGKSKSPERGAKAHVKAPRSKRAAPNKAARKR